MLREFIDSIGLAATRNGRRGEERKLKEERGIRARLADSAETHATLILIIT